MSHVTTDWTNSGHVAILTLSDPDRMNAMTPAMGEALERAIEDAAGAPSLRALVVTGSGRAFSAGGDLDMLEDKTRRTQQDGYDASADMETFYRRFLALRECPVPVIAAVNGHAIGAGLCAALGCDVRVVANEARLGVNFSRVGIHPGMGATWLLPRLVGWQQAADLLFSGRLIDGERARDIGLALESLPTAGVLDHAIALAEEYASASPAVVRGIKHAMAVGATDALPDHLRLEARAQAVTYGKADAVEGLAALRERRSPQFGDT